MIEIFPANQQEQVRSTWRCPAGGHLPNPVQTGRYQGQMRGPGDPDLYGRGAQSHPRRQDLSSCPSAMQTGKKFGMQTWMTPLWTC